MQKIKYKLIDTAGQITGVVTNPVDKNQRASLAQKIMLSDQRIEQVGFLYLANIGPNMSKFTMMGDELCINGTLAAGYLVSQKTGLTDFVMTTSGLDNAVKISRTGNLVSATFPDLVHQNYRR